MDNHRRNMDDNHSILTLSQPMVSVSITSSSTSVSKRSSINEDDSITRTRPLRKRRQQPLSSRSTTENTSASQPSMKTKEKQEARPLGTCVRKCSQCRQLKHVLLAECTVCLRVIDVDLKDCKCQTAMNRNSANHFDCSICKSKLTLDGYVICANRTCQTVLSALIREENIMVTETPPALSTSITNVRYPTSMHRTVALQVNTLVHLAPLQRPLATVIDHDPERWKGDLHRSRTTLSDSFDAFRMSTSSAIDGSSDSITTNMLGAFNSNQPTKLTRESENELRQKPPSTSTVGV